MGPGSVDRASDEVIVYPPTTELTLDASVGEAVTTTMSEAKATFRRVVD